MDYTIALPDEALECIFEYLGATDLIKLTSVCQRFRTLANSERFWKLLCENDWDIIDRQNTNWKEYYIIMYRRFGRYVKCYKRVSRCWDKILDATRTRVPLIHASLLTDGVSEDRVFDIEEFRGNYKQIPLEYFCSYRLCNGQMEPQLVGNDDMSFPGLFGSYNEDDTGDYLCSWTNDGANQMGQHHLGDLPIIRHCCLSLIPVTKRVPYYEHAAHGSVALCVQDNLSSEFRTSCQFGAKHERLNGCMVSVSFNGGNEFFIYSNSFIEYLEDLANKIRLYPVISNRLLKFIFNSESDTGPYHVTTRTSFLRERSRLLPEELRQFHFFYRITMSMADDAPKCLSCQLETRHWVITDGDGHVETVDGPGVVGNYPVMRPGAEFTWISRTSYKTITGKMHGTFKMRKLGSDAEVIINCPEYNLVAPEIVLA